MKRKKATYFTRQHNSGFSRKQPEWNGISGGWFHEGFYPSPQRLSV